MRKGIILFVLTAVVVFGISQLGSYLVYTHLPLHETYVVNSFLHLTHIRNTGGIFGLFPGTAVVFTLVSTLVIVLVCAYVVKTRPAEMYQYLCFGAIVGAAASNVCDRLVYGSVIDFIDVQGIPRWHYIFNVADVAIHLGVWPLVLGSLLSRPPQGEEPAAAKPPQ